MSMEVKTDCRFYRGEIPCEKKKVCWDCDEYEPIGKRVLIIKFGAPGDALRTTPILKKLKEDGFQEITWITDSASVEILKLASNIDRLVTNGMAANLIVQTEHFDTILSLDKDLEAAALATIATSADKRGFCVNKYGRLDIFDERSQYALRLGIDDDLKFNTNDKSVPQYLYEMCGYEYSHQEYELHVETKTKVEILPASVALNVGVGPKWPTKAFPKEKWIALAKLLKENGFQPLIVGGPAETDLIKEISNKAVAREIEPAPLVEFASMLKECVGLVTCDSLALHVGLGIKLPVVGLFCSTTAAEIEWYGRGKAIISDSGPCYNSSCSEWPGCMSQIDPGVILQELKALI
ncbi:MAG: glycosyltransferase family 9 protein [Candidatus Lindowbacteria bacterium]|nr:glycosyltransferase family 9 protein [Candidatus Lindowbacteria bacterium]